MLLCIPDWESLLSVTFKSHPLWGDWGRGEEREWSGEERSPQVSMWMLEMRRHKPNFGTVDEEGWLRDEEHTCSCVMAVFGWAHVTLIDLCWSRLSPLQGGWPWFSPAALAPIGSLTWSWNKNGRNAEVKRSNTDTGGHLCRSWGRKWSRRHGWN